MQLFQTLATEGHEQVVYFHFKEAGLRAIVAIHNTTLGPALGGLRMWPYASEDEALKDVLRLSKGMTYKAAVAGLNLGGGKAVLIGDPETTRARCCSARSDASSTHSADAISRPRTSARRSTTWSSC
jgi:leucine dehydrogenase